MEKSAVEKRDFDIEARGYSRLLGWKVNAEMQGAVRESVTEDLGQRGLANSQTNALTNRGRLLKNIVAGSHFRIAFITSRRGLQKNNWSGPLARKSRCHAVLQQHDVSNTNPVFPRKMFLRRGQLRAILR